MRSITQENFKLDKTCNCKEPIECLEHMFCVNVQRNRVEDEGQCPARRPVFLRTHGILKGEMKVLDNIDEIYKKGIFADSSKPKPIYIRYSSDLADGRPDWESTIGIGIKIFNITGKKMIDDDGANTADLLLQNVPNFFVDDAQDMCEFTKASMEGWGDEWIQKNAPKTNKLLADMAKPIRSVFNAKLWSVLPFKLGKKQYCKYILKPATSTFAEDVDINNPNFLAEDLSSRMKAGSASLDIYIQLRPSEEKFGKAYIDERYPLDKATVVWDEEEAKPVKVATIELPMQDIDKKEQEIYGDWLSFNIGRVPIENQPAPESSIAKARIRIYQTSANYRRKKNEQPVNEPTAPGKPTIKNPKCPFNGQPAQITPKPLTKEQIDAITHVRIHPGIGVSRVGNSAREYTIGPEVINPKPTAFGSTRDEGGAIKRQAARFRIYGYDKNNNVVAEIEQAENSQIEWRVQIANKKSAWYKFEAAMDLPATKNISVSLRNPDITGSARSSLVIDSGEKKIMGLNMNDSTYQLNGSFLGTPVNLGELRTDSVGRLLVLAGHGISGSPSGEPVYDPADPSSFNNHSGWHDDISDGPVHAKVTIGDKVFDADSAWVIAGPPNFAPDLIGWRTMDDLMRSVWIEAGMLAIPKHISFNEHVRPILERLSEMQWLNKGYLAMFGANSPMNFTNPEFMKKLSQAPESSLYPDPYCELRKTIYNSFRPSDNQVAEPRVWPWNYGDTFGYSDPANEVSSAPDTYLKLPEYFDYILSKWVNGDFENDYKISEKHPESIEDVDLQKQPEMLDKSAMHFCLADAFHPGAELTWPMRHASMYRAPYRIRERQDGKNEPSYGAKLTQPEVLKIDGPLYEQSAGDLTRWMAVPWQSDTAYCRSGYDVEYDPYLPTYWPARVPNQVLTESDYNILCDKSKPMQERIAAFNNRPSWFRQLPAQESAPEQMEYMIAHFGEMGILEARPKPDDIDWLPKSLYVENLTETKRKELEDAQKVFMQEYNKLGPYDRALRDAGWFSEEQRNEFSTIMQQGN